MISWIFSIILYLGTVLLGLYIDTKPEVKYKRIRRAYMIWLYIFLCFGYMTGGDWRSYEIIYTTGRGIERFQSEPASWSLFSYCPIFIPDYWLFSGIAKSINLYTAKLLVSKFTSRWLSIMALLIPSQLIFMLIQDPLRFMLAAAVVNIAINYLYLYKTNNDYHNKRTAIIIMSLLLFAILFHNASVVLLLLIPLLFLSNEICRFNSFFIFISYMLVTVVTSNISFIHDLKKFTLVFLQRYMEISDYENYEMEDNSSIFLIGNMLKILFLIFVLVSKKDVITKYKNGGIVYGMTITYFFISRIVVLIPSGFRFAMPFITFYVIYTYFLLSTKKRILAQFIILYTFVSFVNTLWKSYDLIPYSNSIAYIVTGHKPYQDRHMYNLNEYKARTGETYDLPTTFY